jgi:hypothetical protein
MFRTFIIAVLGFAVGAALTYFVVVFGVLAWWNLLNIHDQDGGGAMALGLVIGPFCAVIGGIVAAFLAAVWDAKRRRNSPPATDEENSRDMRRFSIIGGAIVGGIIGHSVVRFGFWLVSPIQFDRYWKVWMHAWLPTIAILLGVVIGGLLARKLIKGWPKARPKR